MILCSLHILDPCAASSSSSPSGHSSDPQFFSKRCCLFLILSQLIYQDPSQYGSGVESKGHKTKFIGKVSWFPPLHSGIPPPLPPPTVGSICRLPMLHVRLCAPSIKKQNCCVITTTDKILTCAFFNKMKQKHSKS